MYPQHWKIENGVPLQKISPPKSEDDLRIISKTPFFSKVLEGYLCEWLLDVIQPYLDQNQYGMKGQSITHYLINFLSFIYASLDSTKPVAVAAAFIDMSKAFNRVDHCILIEDLHAMHCPSWLLKIMISFLSNRVLIVEYNGSLSSSKKLQGGSPAGSLLGQIFFIVKFNGAMMRPPIPRQTLVEGSKAEKAKYMDDASLAVSIPLDSYLQHDENRVKPLTYAERTGHVLPEQNNILQHYLTDVK